MNATFGTCAAGEQDAPHGDDRPHLLNGGESAFAKILDCFDRARFKVDIRAFVWRDDEIGNRIGEAVLRAADRGVHVNIEKDRVAAVYEYAAGTRQSFFHKRPHPTQRFQALFLSAVYGAPGTRRQRPNSLADAILRHPNITVKHSDLRFDHAKLFVFDQSVGVIGSMGIGDLHHNTWVEMAVQLEGEHYIERLRQRLAGETEFDPARKFDFLLHNRKIRARQAGDMVEHRLALIDQAEHSLVVEMAYLGDRRFTEALRRAVLRGVRVKLVTAAQADVLGDLNRATCDRLLRRTGAPANLTIVLMPRMVHAKVVVCDGRYCDIGSANFTPLSNGVYDEINLYVDNPGFAGEVEAAVDGHCEEGEIVGKRIRFRRMYSSVERAIVAFQGRKAS